MGRNRNLVVVRCGDASLHPAWSAGARRWDLAVSYFGSDPAKTFAEADFVHRYKGGKWDGLAAFFAAHPCCVDDYDYVWLPDDDIAADCSTIDQMFATMRKLGLELAQPSLAPGSYVSHLVSLRNPIFSYRNVNLVEIMIPVLDRRLLKAVLPLFADTRSGFGIDFVWQRLTSDPMTRVAVLDDLPVLHTRPVGGPLRQAVAAGMTTIAEEQDALLLPYGDVVTTEMTLGGRLRFGPVIRSPRLAASFAALGWALKPFGNHGFVARLSAPRFLVWVARNWISNMIETRLPTTPLAEPLRSRPPEPSPLRLVANDMAPPDMTPPDMAPPRPAE